MHGCDLRGPYLLCHQIKKHDLTVPISRSPTSVQLYDVMTTLVMARDAAHSHISPLNRGNGKPLLNATKQIDLRTSFHESFCYMHL